MATAPPAGRFSPTLTRETRASMTLDARRLIGILAR
jgi:hypothetical protein